MKLTEVVAQIEEELAEDATSIKLLGYPCQRGEKCAFLRDNGVSKTCGYGTGCIEERERGIL